MEEGQGLNNQRLTPESDTRSYAPAEPRKLRIASTLSTQSPDPAFVDSLTWPDYWSGTIKAEPETRITSEPAQTIKLEAVMPMMEEKLPNQIETPAETEETEPVQEEHAADLQIIQEDLGGIHPVRLESQVEDLSKPLVKPPQEAHPKAVKIPKTPAIKKKAKPAARKPEESMPAETPVDELVTRTGTKEQPHAKAAKDFYQWLNGLPGAAESMRTALAPSKKPVREKAAKKNDAVQAAEDSLKLGESVVSETLAKLLARQGHKEEALAMYEKLEAKFPEKRATFAAAIEKLKS